MLRLLADENFNSDIVRGLLLRHPDVDIVRLQDVGPAGADDARVLEWAAENDRIVLTHDRATMPSEAYRRMVADESMPGVLILNDRFPVGEAIQELLVILECSEQGEWSQRVVYLPL